MYMLVEVWPGVYRIDGPFNKKLNDFCKQGIRFFDFKQEINRKKSWYIPFERLDEVAAKIADLGYISQVQRLPPVALSEPPKQALPHQRLSIEATLLNRVRLLRYDTGCGKSLTALAAAQQVGGYTLIVAPRVVISAWHKEIDKWSAFPTAEIWEQRPGKKLPEMQPDVVICSYGSLHKLPDKWMYDTIIYDEIHYAIHGKSKRSNEIRKLSIRHGHAVRLGLTATPCSAETHNLWGVLHALCPHRWGTWMQWTDRFHRVDFQGYEGRRRVHELLPERVEELTELIATITDVVTQQDLGDHLPPVTWSTEQLPGCTRTKAGLTLGAWRKEQIAVIPQRAEAIAEYIPKGGTRISIVCYHVHLVQLLGDLLGWPTVTGDLPAHKREKVLENANNVVVSMMAITEGLDLRKFTTVLVAESYPVPRFMAQILGRYVRLFAEDAVSITFLQFAGTSDMIITDRLIARIQEQRTLLKGNKLHDGIRQALTMNVESEEFLEKLKGELQTYIETQEGDAWDET